MDPLLSPAERELQARARAFANRVVRPRAAAIDAEGEYPWDIVKALTEAGFVGMTIPKAYGGQDRSFLDAVLVIEEMAKACTVTARIVVETNMGAISTVMAYGSEAQKRLAASLVLAGDKPAICITEPDAGSDAMAMTTRADRRGDKYVINGRKHWITGAGVSRLHLIFARVFDEQGADLGIGGFLHVRAHHAQHAIRAQPPVAAGNRLLRHPDGGGDLGEGGAWRELQRADDPVVDGINGGGCRR